MDFIAEQIKNGEDVELVIESGGSAHLITLTGIMCLTATSCSIDYQDPNFPTTERMNVALNALTLNFFDIPGGTFPGQGVHVRAVFAESVPLPTTWGMLVLGAAMLLVRQRCRHH